MEESTITIMLLVLHMLSTFLIQLEKKIRKSKCSKEQIEVEFNGDESRKDNDVNK